MIHIPIKYKQEKNTYANSHIDAGFVCIVSVSSVFI